MKSSHHPSHAKHRRGLSLLELMLAITITALVGAAIAGMLNAVAVGVDTRRDNRSMMVRSSLAQARLNAYIAPARCVLDQRGPQIVLWFNDQKKSETVHASEIRWLEYDRTEGTLSVSYVSFPEHWSQLEVDQEDREFPSDSDWGRIKNSYASRGLLNELTLVDGLDDVTVTADATDPFEIRLLTYRLWFVAAPEPFETLASGAIRHHRLPQY
ncbi:MAG: hypothetical protein EA377_12025 [Phycisphaerales bacterium]|nr:MAG: hypothetical protein EA377_12025 [Phycisphaerales bacterium]